MPAYLGSRLRCVVLMSSVLFVVPVRGEMIEWSYIGDPGNAADVTDFGAVPYAFKIGTFEVTSKEYSVFLNAVAEDDVHGLYSPGMSWSNERIWGGAGPIRDTR